MTNIVHVLPLYPLRWSFCSEKSKDISSIVYLIPNRRQYQHSFISFRYVKLIAIRTRGDRHCQRCHHRRASRNPSSLEPSVCHVRSPIWRKPKRRRIIAVIVLIILVVVIVIVATFTSSSSRRFPLIMR